MREREGGGGGQTWGDDLVEVLLIVGVITSELARGKGWRGWVDVDVANKGGRFWGRGVRPGWTGSGFLRRAGKAVRAKDDRRGAERAGLPRTSSREPASRCSTPSLRQLCPRCPPLHVDHSLHQLHVKIIPTRARTIITRYEFKVLNKKKKKNLVNKLNKWK